MLLPDEDMDAEDIDRLARQLRRELSEQDLTTQLVPADTAGPEGSKAGDPAVYGAIAVALMGAGGMVPTLIAMLNDWLGRRSGGARIALTIDGDTLAAAWRC